MLAGQAPFRSEVALVTLNVSVRDERNTHVAGLRADEFSVFEDGRPQSVVYFTAERVPLALALMLDSSASMHGHLRLAQEAAAGGLVRHARLPNRRHIDPIAGKKLADRDDLELLMLPPRRRVEPRRRGFRPHRLRRFLKCEQYTEGGLPAVDDAAQIADVRRVQLASLYRENYLSRRPAVLMKVNAPINTVVGSIPAFRWACSDEALAKQCDMSQTAIARIWKAFALQPIPSSCRRTGDADPFAAHASITRHFPLRIEEWDSQVTWDADASAICAPHVLPVTEPGSHRDRPTRNPTLYDEME
jgi:hypothetical protein